MGHRPVTRLFVYGTLLRGEPNAGWLSGARFLGPCSTRAAFTLIDLGPYPAMTAAGDGVVHGELYEIDAATLARLDDFEGHPDLYRRTPLLLADGSVAQAYLLANAAPGTPVIVSGDWRRREPAQRVSAP
jgi:gamma-glutamylaminecyclotransferase